MVYIINDSELLTYAVENGMIDLSLMKDKYEMNKREETLKKHPWAISQGKDGYYRTYIPDEEKGRRMVKKKTKKDIEDCVIAYIREEEENPTIEEVFKEWNDRRLELKKIEAATHTRNIQIFNRHYKEFGKNRIKAVTPDDFGDFLERQIPEYDLTAKAFSNLKTITRGFLKRAKKRKLVNFNVEELFTELDTSDNDFKRVIKEDIHEVFNEDEYPVIMKYLENHLDTMNAGIMLMFVTGMRIGELVALKHENICDYVIKVRSTETRYCNEDGGYVYEIKDFPKTAAGARDIIVPKDYYWLCDYVNNLSPKAEYVFTSRGQRIKTYSIRSRLRRICKKTQIEAKSPHKIRKTYGSILLDNQVDNKIVIDMMGHTDVLCTENFYHKNRKTLKTRSNIISQIPEFSSHLITK